MQVGLSTDESLFIGQWVVLVLVPAANNGLVVQRQTLCRYTKTNWKFRLTWISLLSPFQPRLLIQLLVMQLQARHYGGWGLRYAENTLALIPSSGRAILITLDWGEQIAVRMNEPDDFVGKYEKEIAG